MSGAPCSTCTEPMPGWSPLVTPEIGQVGPGVLVVVAVAVGCGYSKSVSSGCEVSAPACRGSDTFKPLRRRRRAGRVKNSSAFQSSRTATLSLQVGVRVGAGSGAKYRAASMGLPEVRAVCSWSGFSQPGCCRPRAARSGESPEDGWRRPRRTARPGPRRGIPTIGVVVAVVVQVAGGHGLPEAARRLGTARERPRCSGGGCSSLVVLEDRSDERRYNAR